MNKFIRILISTEIPGITGKIKLSSIEKKLSIYISTIAPLINFHDLDDWQLLISITIRPTNGVGVFKRAKRYPSDREFEISISLTIPDDEQASYGLPNVKSGFFNAMNEKNFYILDPTFENHEEIQEYIFENAKKAIELGFTHGFSCNGKRIKTQNQPSLA